MPEKTNTKNERLSDIRKGYDKWKIDILKPQLDKYPEMKEEFTTISNKKIKRLYTPLDTAELDYNGDLGYPGEYPFTRGVQPTMYRGRLWTMRQYAGFGSAEDTNKRFRYLLDHGQTGLSVAFDLPTQMGYDSDHLLSAGEVGKVGVSIDSMKDMEDLFNKIPLENVSTSMTINSTAAIILSMYVAVAEGQGADTANLRGTVQNDVLKEYIARGTYIYPPKASMKIITDIFEYCSKHHPKWNTISVSGYHIREAGSTAVQELGFTLANAIAYLDAALEKGLLLDDFAPQIAFFFNSHIDFFEEIAKFRAARRMWARIMKERYGSKNPNSCRLRFHTQTAGVSLTAQQPEVNIVRVTLEALAAVLGGTQSLHTNSMDEAIGLPSEKAVRIALRTQQVLGYESGITNTVDPLAGSYFIENLTDELEQEAFELIKRVDDIGGMVNAIEKGFVQKEIHESAYVFQKQVEEESRILIGVNHFTVEEETKLKHLKIPASIEQAQKERLKALRNARDDHEVEKILASLAQAAEADENLMPIILKAVKVEATVGEIAETLKSIYGEYRAPQLF